MADRSKRTKATSRGVLSNHRLLCKRAMMLRALESSRATRKHWQKNFNANMKRKTTDKLTEPSDTLELVKKSKTSSKQPSENTKTEVSEPGLSEPKAPGQHRLATAVRDSWEVDSGFSSEGSPPASGRSSPCLSSSSTTVVALDCEMVGTGPKGCCNELARCSILDYHGNVLYNKYVRPRQPVTDYRTRWSGIRRHHLHDATPFNQAREEILSILEGKVIVGHSVHNDFAVLDLVHPPHMVRDTFSSPLLSRLAGFPRRRSLKSLASQLLSREIQRGQQGHCSVEDARAALDLYKLVEGEWEEQEEEKMRDDADTSQVPNSAASNHYMQDEYWPEDVITDSQ